MEIAVAGAGVAGLAAAAFLARQGHRVVIFDQLESPAPVGSGLIVQPTGQAVLFRLGLLTKLLARGAPLTRLYAETTSGRAVLNVRYGALGANVCGVGLHRAALFDMLFDAAMAAGAEFAGGRAISAIEPVAGGVRLRFAGGGSSAAFGLCVDAMGLKSPAGDHDGATLDYGALWTNVPWPERHPDPYDRLTQRYRSAHRSVGLMPIGRLEAGGPPLGAFFWTLRHDYFRQWREKPLAAWRDDVATLWPDVIPAIEHLDSHEQFIFARYAHRTRKSPVSRHTAHLGDAWHAASPQLGQGANMALLDALALATAFEQSGDAYEILRRYARARRGHVRLYQAISGAFTPVYQSDAKLAPALRDVFAAPVSATPPMPRLLAGMVAGVLGRPLRGISNAG